MGKMIAREIDNLTWRVAGCLLFIGISAPSFHKFYRNGIEHSFLPIITAMKERVSLLNMAKRVRIVKADTDKMTELHS